MEMTLCCLSLNKRKKEITVNLSIKKEKFESDFLSPKQNFKKILENFHAITTHKKEKRIGKHKFSL